MSMFLTWELTRGGRTTDGVHVIHVVRDPRDFVTSFMNWKRQSAKRTILHHAVPAWQPNPWLSRECGLGSWLGMDKFEHFCWVWNFKNRLFEELADRVWYRRLRLEDLVTGDRGVERFAELCRDMKLSVDPDFDPLTLMKTRVNPSQQGFTASWGAWTPDMAAVLERHCGDLMRRYGYGEEVEWERLSEPPHAHAH